MYIVHLIVSTNSVRLYHHISLVASIYFSDGQYMRTEQSRGRQKENIALPATATQPNPYKFIISSSVIYFLILTNPNIFCSFVCLSAHEWAKCQQQQQQYQPWTRGSNNSNHNKNNKRPINLISERNFVIIYTHTFVWWIFLPVAPQTFNHRRVVKVFFFSSSLLWLFYRFW